MKILIIDGCPRKENTWKIVQIAKEQIRQKYSNVEFEEIEENMDIFQRLNYQFLKRYLQISFIS